MWRRRAQSSPSAGRVPPATAPSAGARSPDGAASERFRAAAPLPSSPALRATGGTRRPKTRVLLGLRTLLPTRLIPVAASAVSSILFSLLFFFLNFCPFGVSPLALALSVFPHTHSKSRPKLSSASLRARCRPCVHARSAFQSLDCSSAWQSLSRVSLSSFHLPVPFRPLPKTCGDLSTAAACYPPRTSLSS